MLSQYQNNKILVFLVDKAGKMSYTVSKDVEKSREGCNVGFGEQLRQRRKELGLSREELADKLGVTRSAVGNYETGLSAPKESVLLRLFDVLQVEPNYLYRDFYAAGRAGQAVSEEEQSLLKKYRELGLAGRQTLSLMLDALSLMQAEAEQDRPAAEARTIPLYCSPAAAGYAAPVFGEDYEPLPVTGGGGLCGPGVWRGLRAAACGGGRSPRGGAGGANPRGQHGALYPRRIRGICKPRPLAPR